jgi:uncharacterized protein YbaA (DUF1428 family)
MMYVEGFAGEIAVFSWLEYPSKTTREGANEKS